jgi:hypothetical protein
MMIRIQENVSCATKLAAARASWTFRAFRLNQLPKYLFTMATMGMILKAQAPSQGQRISMYAVIPVICTTASILREEIMI